MIDNSFQESNLPPRLREDSGDTRWRGVRIDPGDYCVCARKGVYLHTLLGSCVSVCLLDPVSGVFGINHFLLVDAKGGMENDHEYTDSGRYGVHAMDMLIERMVYEGAEKERLQAKAFGGANVLEFSNDSNFNTIGSANIAFVREYLKKTGIPLLAEDMGGDRGRVLYFIPEDFSIYVRKIMKKGTIAVERAEKALWRQLLVERQRAAGLPDNWWLKLKKNGDAGHS